MSKAAPIKLGMYEAHILATLMLNKDEGFTAKQMTLDQYATFASERCGFVVTKAQVHTRVREFGLAYGKPERVETNLDVLATTVLAQGQELADLKERVARLEGWVNTTFPSKSPLKVVG